MNKEKVLKILRLLSTIKNTIDMKIFRNQVPSDIINKLDNEILWLFTYMMEIKDE